MNNNSMNPVLFILLMLWIGTWSPSDGVDAPIYKDPLELIITAVLIVFALSTGVLLFKKCGYSIQ